MWSTTHTTGI